MSPEQYSENFYEKAAWFNRIRGEQSGAQLNRRWHAALAQMQVMREARTTIADPGGAAIKGAFAISGAPRGTKVAEVDNPYAAASRGFASPAVEVQLAGPPRRATTLRLRPVRGARSRVNLATAMVFRWNDAVRRWHLVDQSGYSASSRTIWARIDRGGIYAAIALPAAEDDARALALTRVRQYYASLALESGLASHADEVLDRDTFARLLDVDPGLHGRESASTRSRLMALHRSLHRSLRRATDLRIPPGGFPEWHLIEHLHAVRADLVVSAVGDLVNRFPWIFHVANRVGRWYPNGPLNVSGRVKSLAIHPTNGNILYAGAADGGIWKSTDAGQVWSHLWTFEDSMAVGSVAIAESAPNTIYVATGEDAGGWTPSYGGVGVYKSTNGGSTWQLKSNAATLGARCTKILVHPTNPNVVYLASEAGVFKSTTGGDTWTLVKAGHATDLVMAHDRPDILYAGIWNDGLYKTTTGGTAWNRITSNVTVFIVIAIFTIPFPTGSDAGWIKLAIGREGPYGSEFVIAKLGDKGGNTYATFDGGNNWGPAGGTEAVDYDEWCSMAAIHPRDPRKLFIGGLNLQYSYDGFNFHPTNGTHSDHHQVVFDPHDNNVCYCCCDGGVYRSHDGGQNWSSRSEYMQATQLMSLGVSQGGTFVAGSATQDQGVIQTNGSSWWDDFGAGNEWGMFVVDPNDSNHMYVSPGDGELRRSLDGGHSWTNPTQGLTDPWASQGRQTKPASFAHVAARPGISNFLIGAATVYDEVKDGAGNVTDSYGPIHRLYYSRDWGNSWWNAHTLASSATRVAYAPSDNNRCYAATETGKFLRNDHGGELGWYEPASGANKPPGGYITCITVDPFNANVVFITYGDHNPHVYRSSDGGQHWTAAAGTAAGMTLPDIAASALVVDSENDDVLYIGTDIGVFRSNDWGYSWYPYNDAPGSDDLPKVVVSGLAQHQSTHRLFASTMGRGLYYTYTTGFVSLRVLAVSYYYHGRPQAGIVNLRVTDGSQTYVMTRADVIRRIEAGTEVYTIGSDGRRADVVVMEPDATHPIQYLQTITDYTTPDNLGSLPRF
ncbi:MAG TPA: DUF3892 domain-containing protein [Jatrophihabitantaceae bacterium]|nr:DUF3892 domain-containing protein [Jatrophihabitantaceae bacterium]